MGFGQGIHLQAAILGSGNGKYAQRLASTDKAIRIIVDNQYLMLQAKRDEPLVQSLARAGSGRHSGIDSPHHLHPAEVHPLKRIEIRDPAIFGKKVVVADFRAGNQGCGRICGIARIRD
jgi:hypothetical protein